jgi:excisionase family DNA binding protein
MTPEDLEFLEDQELLRELRPLVRKIVQEMCAVGGRSIDELTRWQRLTHAVCDEMVKRGDLDAAIERVVCQKLGERIGREVEAFMRARWTEEMRTKQLLVAQGEVYLTVKRAAGIADCSERTITRALDAEKMPTYYAGNDRRVKLADLRNYLAKKRPVEPDGEE